MISARLKAVAELLNGCGRIIDIGCDHGYLGVYLLQNKLVEHVSFVDVSKTALTLAKKNVQRNLSNYDTCTDFQLSDGFNGLKPTVDYDALVITGLGATKISKIIADKKHKIRLGVLGPQGDVSFLRHFLNSLKIKIVDEKIICERNFFYELIKVDFDKKINREYSQLEELIGPVLLKKNEKMLYRYWQKKLDFLQSLPTCRYTLKIRLIKQFLSKKVD